MYKLIIIDDEEKIASGMAQLFPWQNIGFEVVQVFTGARKALQYIAENPVDVVLTDIEMPDMNGLELSQRLKTLLQWLSAHYTEELRVADAAGVCSFSASHFMRWFRQMTGQSFVAFLNEYRLNAAAEALQATDETVLTIASRCGFENLSYFNRAFKAHFGMTPREYRKK